MTVLAWVRWASRPVSHVAAAAVAGYALLAADWGPEANIFTPLRQRLGIDRREQPTKPVAPAPSSQDESSSSGT
jgi:hypothetical protein